MTASERTFLDTLQRDTQGRIVYTYRGQIERGARYDWKPGYSATTGTNGDSKRPERPTMKQSGHYWKRTPIA